MEGDGSIVWRTQLEKVRARSRRVVAASYTRCVYARGRRRRRTPTSNAIAANPDHPMRDCPPTASQLQPLVEGVAVLLVAMTHAIAESQMYPSTHSATLLHAFLHAPALQRYGEQSLLLPFTSCAVWLSAQIAAVTHLLLVVSHENPPAQSAFVLHVDLHATPLHPKPPQEDDSRFTAGMHVPALTVAVTLATPPSPSHAAIAHVVLEAHSSQGPDAQSCDGLHASPFPIRVSHRLLTLQ
jgi:hypothetical protein